jgi:hypothetical protein
VNCANFGGLNVRIFFEPNTLRQSKKGSVTGVVYFEFSPDRQFPAPGWNDFVVVVANWWRFALEQIIEGQAEADLWFMDGPYRITAIFQGTNLLLRCIEDRRGVGLVNEVVVQVDDLKRELLSFARHVSAACKAAGIESADLDELRCHLPNWNHTGAPGP